MTSPWPPGFSALRGSGAYRWARRRAVRWLRVSATGKRIMRAAGMRRAGSVEGVPVTAGSGVPRPEAGLMEPVLVVATEASMEQMSTLLVDLQRWQLEQGVVRPVLVVTGSAMQSVRPYGYPVECLIPEEQWAGSQPWSHYVRGHIARIRRTYGTTSTLVLGGEWRSVL